VHLGMIISGAWGTVYDRSLNDKTQYAIQTLGYNISVIPQNLGRHAETEVDPRKHVGLLF